MPLRRRGGGSFDSMTSLDGKPWGLLQPAKCQSGAYLHMGLIEDNETSSPLRQHGTYTKRKLSPAHLLKWETGAFYQTNCPKKASNCFPCNVYLKALVNRCCWIQSWAWHGFSIWFTAILRLNSSLWFLTVNLLGLVSIFQRHSKCHYEIYCNKKSYTHNLFNKCTISNINTQSHI